MGTILATDSSPVEATSQPPRWQVSLKNAIRSGTELCRVLQLPEQLSSAQAADDFPVFAPREFVARMKTGDMNDPLLKQVLAAAEETSGEGMRDPLAESEMGRMPGMLQKYAGRVLLITSAACAIHCRYCFRRHFPYEQQELSRRQRQAWIAAIRSDSTISEVLLSGGDPLSLPDAMLAELVAGIAEVPHVRRIRFHTRLPIVIPERVCDTLTGWLADCPVPVTFVLHSNHSNELDETVAEAVAKLRTAGANVLNQAVLLAGVNDSFRTQYELCERLLDLQVLPYYLHLFDRVQGAMHFDVDDSVGISIVTQLRRKLPGYGVPRLVREAPGAEHKTVIA